MANITHGGETEEKDSYSLNNYQYFDKETYEFIYIGNDISGTDYDVAHIKWGNDWRMPTIHEIEELAYNCVRVEASINGISGIKSIGPSGKAIFLPTTGFEIERNDGIDGSGRYWSSTMLKVVGDENWYGTAYNLDIKY